ncbi:S-adenosyl-L-methionine-dependent methyltransferase [Aspergillus cavernicola]|uniref:S-adenosyl-L-methionine-dependent methyltransferase n=1 Tax=Aspergillus cavernicola TaxID=176166 RepID=A0ABR4I762_9EURO
MSTILSSDLYSTSIVRLMRILCGLGIFKEVSVATFESTPLAKAYATGSPFKQIAIHLASHAPIAALMPNYFAEKGYNSPNDTFDGPFQYALSTKQHYFDWVASDPRLQHAFNTVMSTCPGNRGQDWFEFYPVEEKLRVSTPSDVLIVDVGGNIGEDLAQPEVIEAMDHDFFSPQPVKGAKAYYLRLVLHDWPDKQAKLILGHLRNAMTPGSVLLINETLVPESGVPLYDAWMDMTMLAVFSSLNRTETQFRELLGSVGFEVINVWKPEVAVPGSTALFEAVVQ